MLYHGIGSQKKRFITGNLVTTMNYNFILIYSKY